MTCNLGLERCLGLVCRCLSDYSRVQGVLCKGVVLDPVKLAVFLP